MRKILSALFALMMLLGTTASIATAQEGTPEAPVDGEEVAAPAGGDTAFARGMDAEATYFSERGDPIATLKVVDVERGWQDYGEYDEPAPGVEYVAVTFEVSVVSRGNLIVEAYDVSMVDSLGQNNSRSWASPAENSGITLFDDDVAVASGETTELTVIFEVYEQAEVGFFMWQPESGIIVMVDLSEA